MKIKRKFVYRLEGQKGVLETDFSACECDRFDLSQFFREMAPDLSQFNVLSGYIDSFNKIRVLAS